MKRLFLESKNPYKYIWDHESVEFVKINDDNESTVQVRVSHYTNQKEKILQDLQYFLVMVLDGFYEGVEFMNNMKNIRC